MNWSDKILPDSDYLHCKVDIIDHLLRHSHLLGPAMVLLSHNFPFTSARSSSSSLSSSTMSLSRSSAATFGMRSSSLSFSIKRHGSLSPGSACKFVRHTRYFGKTAPRTVVTYFQPRIPQYRMGEHPLQSRCASCRCGQPFSK